MMQPNCAHITATRKSVEVIPRGVALRSGSGSEQAAVHAESIEAGRADQPAPDVARADHALRHEPVELSR